MWRPDQTLKKIIESCERRKHGSNVQKFLIKMQ